MRVRYNKNATEELQAFDHYLPDANRLQEQLQKKENQGKKIYVEIGMGKGDFIFQMAAQDPDSIYIGVEVCISILALAAKKITRYKKEHAQTLSNLYVMSFDAKEIATIFKAHQIEKIYLNFSDPWPKKKHTKRRLTYQDFLIEYQKVLKTEGIIEFKTDNRILFEYSLISLQQFGMQFLEVFLDLHQTDIPNVETEYERKFSALGPIYKLVASMPKS